jgi:hypothetical protein
MPTSDDRLQGWIEGLLDRSRDQLRGEIEQLVRSVSEAAASEQDDIARNARAAGEAAAAALAAEAIQAERRAADQRQTEALQASREACRSEQARALAEAQAEHEGKIERLRTEHARAFDSLRTELQQERAANAAKAEEHAGLATAVPAEVRHGDLIPASTLLDAVRALDGASSLTEILERLSDEAARHTPRSAVLLAQNGHIRGWRWTGIPGEATTLELPLADRGLVATAARTGLTQWAASPAPASVVLSPHREGRAGVAVPVLLDQQVVAVLYGDDDLDNAASAPESWPELVEVLARHAGRCLEAMTARKMPDLLKASAAERARRRSLDHEEEAAQRCARLLVAEIKLYHETTVEEARQRGDILRRLRPQIERAQQLYAERVPSGIRDRTDYFDQELVRTLAGGDPALLGQAT